jgi:CRP/FNR family transcriptional regulator, cyclic AMP receptor protein
VAQGPVDLLKRVPIFEGLGDRDLQRIAGSMKRRTFRAGDTVTTEGRGGVGFFVIEDGEAKVTVHGQDRRRLGPGDYFGEVALLTDSPRTATITAESELRCYGMTSWDFKPLVETHSSIAWNLLQAMARNYSGN